MLIIINRSSSLLWYNARIILSEVVILIVMWPVLYYITAAGCLGVVARWSGLPGCLPTVTLNHVVVFEHNKLWQSPDGNSFSVTSQVLWPKAATNCGDLWP